MSRKLPLEKSFAVLVFMLTSSASSLHLQGAAATSSAGEPAALSITLQDAISRAEKYGNQIQAADIAARLAHEDKTQARAATLPSLNALNQFIYTEGNGTPSGVFVANDGVHVYNEQAVVHEEVLSFLRRGEIRMAAAAEAVARARLDVTTRGLKGTVIQDYFAIAGAERKLKNAQRSLSEAREFFDVTQKQEQAGEAAHADVIKAQLQVQQRQRDIQDAVLAVQKAKISLAVLIFPSLQLNYTVVDDLAELGVLPPLNEASAQATAGSPDLHAAREGLTEARLGVSVAKYAYLPSLSLDLWYGIDANQFAFRTDHPTGESGRSTLPNYLVPYRQNLGYSAAATLNVPIWNWGAIHSKVKQAGLRERQAELDLTLTQKQVQADIISSYQEAQTAFSQVASLRDSSNLSNESLRLALRRYEAGEATALEVVDAQTTANAARSAFDDGLVRYRIAAAGATNSDGNFLAMRTFTTCFGIVKKSAFPSLTLGVPFLIACLLLGGCSKKDAAGGADEASAAAPVQVAPVERKPIHSYVTAEAILYPLKQATITPKINAPVARFLVQRGDHVREGQLLATLEDRDLVAAAQESKQLYEQAQAAYQNTSAATMPEDLTKAETDLATAREGLDAARRVYENRLSLLHQGAIAQKLVDDAKVALVTAQSQFENAQQHLKSLNTVGRTEQLKSASAQAAAAKAHYESAEAQVSYAGVRSPMSGVVSDRPLNVGEMANSGSALLSIVDLSRVVARASIPVHEAALLKVGKPATISSAGREVPAKITVVSPAVDPNTTTVQVWVEALNPGEHLKLGSTVQISMDAGEIPDAIVVPVSALLPSEEGGEKVMVAGSDNVAHDRAIKVGVRSGDETQILSGLKPGEQVITQGGLGLDDKAKIQIVKPEAPGAADTEK